MDRLLTLDLIINCILVKEGVRPAMLLQPVNYGETSGNDPKTKHIMEQIKSQYPELCQSENYDTFQGVLISKTCYDGEKDITLNKMGEILGYPCYENFSEINRDETSYFISVEVLYYALPPPKLDLTQYFPSTDTDIHSKIEKIYTCVDEYLNVRKSTCLFVNVCQNTNKMPEFEKLKTDALKVLSAPKYIELFKSINIDIDEIKIVVEPNVPTVSLIQKLINNEQLSVLEKDEMQNDIWNIFTDDADEIFSNIQFNNPVHVGMMIHLLSGFLFDMVSPFYPLYQYPEKTNIVSEITKQLSRKIVTNLQKTRLCEVKTEF